MSNYNVYPILITWKVNAKGESPLGIAIDLNNKRAATKYIGRKIPVECWDEVKKKVKKNIANYDLINKMLDKKIAEISGYLMKQELLGVRLTKSVINDYLKGKDSSSVIGFFEDFISYIKEPRKTNDDQREKGKMSAGNIRKWESELNRLKLYDSDVRFSDVDIKWMERYETYCAKTLKKDTSLPTTINRFIQILNKAAKKGLYDVKKIEGYKPPVYVNPTRDYLTLEETDSIGNLIYEGKLETYPETLKVACYFLVECYAGIRFSDWDRYSLETIIDKRRLKVRAKKNGEPVYVPLDNSPKLKKIIDYILKHGIVFDITQQTTNRLLKNIGVMAEVSVKLTTHVGRHTCATLLLEIGYSKETVAEWLGISVKTVEIYAKMTRRKIQNEYDKLGGL